MLTKHERRVAARALSIAYHRYRNLSIKEFCRLEKVFVEKDPKCDAWGLYSRADHLGPKYRHRITLLPSIPRLHKHKTFWHEVGHLVVGKLGYFPSYVGYHAYLYEFTNDHWEHERLVESFATAMTLHRSGVEPDLRDREAFFFADETSLTYGQMMRFNAARIESYCEEVRTKRRNIDLSELEELVELLKKGSHYGAVQPYLPMDYEDVHREPSELKYHWVDWYEDWERNHNLHGKKDSWRERFLEEAELVRQANKLRDHLDHPQLALLKERALADQARFERRRRRFERAMDKYQKT